MDAVNGQDDISSEKTDDARLTLLSPTLEDMELMNQAPQLFVNDASTNEKSDAEIEESRRLAAEIEESRRLAAKIDEEDKTRFIRIKPHEKKKPLRKTSSKTSQTSVGSKTSKEKLYLQMGYDDTHSFVSADNTSMRDSMKQKIDLKIKSVWDKRIEEARAIEVIRKTDSGLFVTRSGTKLAEDDDGNLCDMETGDIVFKTEAIKSANKIAKMAKARDISNLIRSKSGDGLVSDSGYEYVFDSSGNLVDEEGTVVYTARELEESGKNNRAMAAMMKAEAKEMAWNWPRASFGVGGSYGSRASFGGLAPSDQTLDKRHSVYSDARDKSTTLGNIGEGTGAATGAAAGGRKKLNASAAAADGRLLKSSNTKTDRHQWDAPLGPHKLKRLPAQKELGPQILDYVQKTAMKKPCVSVVSAGGDAQGQGIDQGQGQNQHAAGETAGEYLQRHGIESLFKWMTVKLLVERPTQPLDCMIEIAHRRAEQVRLAGGVGGVGGVGGSDETVNTRRLSFGTVNVQQVGDIIPRVCSPMREDETPWVVDSDVGSYFRHSSYNGAVSRKSSLFSIHEVSHVTDVSGKTDSTYFDKLNKRKD